MGFEILVPALPLLSLLDFAELGVRGYIFLG